jgi:hypothetical protein
MLVLGDTALTIATSGIVVATVLLASATLVAARTASRQLNRDLRPVVAPQKMDEEWRTVRFSDGRIVALFNALTLLETISLTETVSPFPGFSYTIDLSTSYLAVCLNNVGTGVAVVHAINVSRSREFPSSPDQDAPSPASLVNFNVTTRPLYLAPGESRYLLLHADTSADDWFGPLLHLATVARINVIVEILYTDQTSRQPTVTRIELAYDVKRERWFAYAIGDWSIKTRAWKTRQSMSKEGARLVRKYGDVPVDRFPRFWPRLRRSSVLDQIEELRERRADGLVTPGEFDAWMAEVLDRLRRSSVFDQIWGLGERRAEGLVTEEEFETKKAELLARL